MSDPEGSRARRARPPPIDVILCDVAALDRPDLETIDALARLQLEARRSGCIVWLRGACRELQELLALMGLSDVVPLWGDLPVESRRQIEQREPARGVEEEADPADPVA